MKNDRFALIRFMIAMTIFGTIGVFRRYIPMPSAAVAFYRGIIGTAALLIFDVFTKRKPDFRRAGKKIWLIVLSGALIGVNWALLFEAYNHTTVAVATLCYYMAPVIVILVSPLLFKERLTVKQLVCTAAAIAGMVLVSGVTSDGGLGGETLVGVATALAAAAIYASVVLLNKKLPETEPISTTIVQLASAAAVLVPYLIFTNGFAPVKLDPVAVIMLIALGAVHTGLTYALYFGSIGKLSPTKVALFSYIDPVLTVILSATVLHEPSSWQTWLGAALIIIGTNKKRP